MRPGATVFGTDARVSPEWAAWANGTAVRELDFHDTFLAVAQHVGTSGADMVGGIATGYEIQVNLVRGICLHEHKIDHIAHLRP